MITRTVLFVGALTLAGTAQAALIATEWERASIGNTSLTLDTNTSLEWLDMAYTTGKSFNDVQARLNSDLAGFRVANYYEVEELLHNAGINYIGYAPKDVGEGANMATLLNLLGRTEAFSLVGMFEVGGFTQPGHPLWRFSLLSDGVTTTTYTEGPFQDHYFAGYVGTFLVRDVAAIPEPETYGMFLAGLGLIGFMVRRRKQIYSLPAKMEFK